MKTWADIRAWRKTERARLIAERMALSGAVRKRHNAAITAALEKQLSPQMVIGFYWPIRGEYDARQLVRTLLDQGARAALPAVVQKGAPLVFRDWRPGTRMELGFWDIPVPAEDNPAVPTILLVPLVGFDEVGFRLGYGGGYYDRTLASMPDRPLAIGIGYELSHLETIYPQPHDIPMTAIVTESRIMSGQSGSATLR
jgi:5-formyltetrahydrofolate cyclo-ligase